MRKTIILKTPEQDAEFVNICSKYVSDINLYDGHIAIDAKSIVSVFSIAQGKPVEVEMISKDGTEVENFENDIRKFEVCN